MSTCGLLLKGAGHQKDSSQNSGFGPTWKFSAVKTPFGNKCDLALLLPGEFARDEVSLKRSHSVRSFAPLHIFADARVKAFCSFVVEVCLAAVDYLCMKQSRLQDKVGNFGSCSSSLALLRYQCVF